jgi:hypothetical protein
MPKFDHSLPKSLLGSRAEPLTDLSRTPGQISIGLATVAPANRKEQSSQGTKKSPVSSTGRASGTSTKLSEEDAFVKAQAKAKSRGRKST